jgi:hypothetical protein
MAPVVLAIQSTELLTESCGALSLPLAVASLRSAASRTKGSYGFTQRRRRAAVRERISKYEAFYG